MNVDELREMLGHGWVMHKRGPGWVVTRGDEVKDVPAGTASAYLRDPAGPQKRQLSGVEFFLVVAMLGVAGIALGFFGMEVFL